MAEQPRSCWHGARFCALAVVAVFVVLPALWDIGWHVPGRVDFVLHYWTYHAIVAEVKQAGMAPGSEANLALHGIEVWMRRDNAGRYSISLATADWGHAGHAGYTFLDDSADQPDISEGDWNGVGERLGSHWWTVYHNLD